VGVALAPGGTWLLADILGEETLRENVTKNKAAATMFAFSTCLCMSCSLSCEDVGDGKGNGKGLGTLGFTVPVAKQLLGEAGFKGVQVLHEYPSTRWFQVAHEVFPPLCEFI